MDTKIEYDMRYLDYQNARDKQPRRRIILKVVEGSGDRSRNYVKCEKLLIGPINSLGCNRDQF